MIVRNIRSGKEFQTTLDEFSTVIEQKGNAHMYEIVENDAPVEVKVFLKKKTTEPIGNVGDNVNKSPIVPKEEIVIPASISQAPTETRKPKVTK